MNKKVMKESTGLYKARRAGKEVQTRSQTKIKKLIRVRAVEPLDGRRVHITFTDGTKREMDLTPHIWGPAFRQIREHPELFRRVYVDPESGTLAWSDELDLDPDTLYYGENAPWANQSDPVGKGRGKKDRKPEANAKSANRHVGSQTTRATRAKHTKGTPTRPEKRVQSKVPSRGKTH